MTSFRPDGERQGVHIEIIHHLRMENPTEDPAIFDPFLGEWWRKTIARSDLCPGDHLEGVHNNVRFQSISAVPRSSDK